METILVGMPYRAGTFRGQKILKNWNDFVQGGAKKKGHGTRNCAKWRVSYAGVKRIDMPDIQRPEGSRQLFVALLPTSTRKTIIKCSSNPTVPRRSQGKKSKSRNT